MRIDRQISQLSSDAVPQAAEIQGRAFFDDPAMVYVFPDDNTRLQRLPWLMGIGIGYGCRFGSVSTTTDPMLGHAVWLPPGGTSMSDEGMDEVGFGEAPARMGEDALGRFGAFIELVSGHHERLVPVPHWYLLILGVEPEYQGKGIGTSLITPGLARADAEGLPCYLETSKERNLPFYQRHGFEVRQEDDIPGGGPKVWMMVREPRG
jgi:GNAT superfamily N-acetyltransferase